MDPFGRLRSMGTRAYFAIFGTAAVAGSLLSFYACIQYYGGACWRVPPV